jgi:chaperonin GroEL
LELVAQQSKPLVIIGDEIEGEVLHTLIINKMKGVLSVCAVKAPSYGENRTDILTDLAIVTGGQVIDASSPTALKNIQLPELGTCKKIIITRNTTTVIGENSRTEIKEAVEKRVEMLKSALSESNVLDELRRNNYKNRLAKLAGGVAIIKVGGSTEVEILEKKDRVEDALNATVAAVQEGIIPGGGVALFYISRDLEGSCSKLQFSDDELAGWKIITNACKAPLRVIVENTGKSAEVVMNKLVEGSQKFYEPDFGLMQTGPCRLPYTDTNFGYDAYKHEYGNMIDCGIIDPVKVSRYAISHASSVVGLLLTCDAVIVNEEKEQRS